MVMGRSSFSARSFDASAKAACPAPTITSLSVTVHSQKNHEAPMVPHLAKSYCRIRRNAKYGPSQPRSDTSPVQA